ncbi:hypothetical protein [Streptomyces sp. SGAir0957]
MHRLASRLSATAITAWTWLVNVVDRRRIARDDAMLRRYHETLVASIPADAGGGLAEILRRRKEK